MMIMKKFIIIIVFISIIYYHCNEWIEVEFISFNFRWEATGPQLRMDPELLVSSDITNFGNVIVSPLFGK